MEKSTDTGNNLNIRIQLFKESNPFIYIQNDLDSKRYRISTNYEYLNSKFNLRIQFVRDFNKLEKLGSKRSDIKTNTLIEWLIFKDQQSIYFKDPSSVEVDEMEFKYNSVAVNDTWNIFKIFKYTFGTYEQKNRTSVLIFNKKFGDDSSYSLFFSSEKFVNLDEFLLEVSSCKKESHEISS